MNAHKISVIVMLLVSSFISLLGASMASDAWQTGGWKAAGAVVMFAIIIALWYGTAIIIDRMKVKAG